MIDILYVLPTRLFFMEGPCGRVSHARGFIKGLKDNSYTIGVMCGEGIHSYIDKYYIDSLLKVKSLSFLWVFTLLLKLCLYQHRYKKVVIRWRPFIPFLLLLLFFKRKKIWLELNSITGLDSKFYIIRAIAKLSVFISAKIFNVIVVSENSRENVVKISGVNKNKIWVIKNGFDARYFKQFSITPSNNDISLVYFGAKQSYYDWNLLYSVITKVNNKAGKIITLYVFGFYEDKVKDNIVNYGKFSPKSLVADLEAIPNPVLILHSSNSNMARAGSPMKLYEYAALGIPCIISTSMYENAKEFPGFIFYEAGNDKSLHEAINYVEENYIEIFNNAKKARQISIDSYTWRSVVRRWCAYVLD